MSVLTMLLDTHTEIPQGWPESPTRKVGRKLQSLDVKHVKYDSSDATTYRVTISHIMDYCYPLSLITDKLTDHLEKVVRGGFAMKKYLGKIF